MRYCCLETTYYEPNKVSKSHKPPITVDATYIAVATAAAIATTTLVRDPSQVQSSH